jgi:hypothetical protein
MQKLLLVCWVLAFACAFLVYPVLGILSSTAVEAWVIVARDPDGVLVEKEMFDPPKSLAKDSPAYRKQVLNIYGIPVDSPTKVIFVPKSKFIQPQELPSITILPKQKNEDPMQLQLIQWIAPRFMFGASVVGFFLVIPWIVLRRQSLKEPPPPAKPAA